MFEVNESLKFYNDQIYCIFVNERVTTSSALFCAGQLLIYLIDQRIQRTETGFDLSNHLSQKARTLRFIQKAGTRNYQSYTDQLLVELLCKDDTGAFEEIYRRYWKRLLTMAWNHSGSKVAAEDIVHEVFISLWERKRDVEIYDVCGF